MPRSDEKVTADRAEVIRLMKSAPLATITFPKHLIDVAREFPTVEIATVQTIARSREADEFVQYRGALNDAIVAEKNRTGDDLIETQPNNVARLGDPKHNLYAAIWPRTGTRGPEWSSLTFMGCRHSNDGKFWLEDNGYPHPDDLNDDQLADLRGLIDRFLASQESKE
jgi:hypothetical protein